MSEAKFDIATIIPSREVKLDFSVMPGQLSSKEGFTEAVRALAGEGLPHFFPNIPDFVKARNSGVTTNSDYRDSQLSLPAKLYDSDTFTENLLLRGPMEVIIMAYEKQRIKHGLSRNHLIGKGWTKSFRLRFARLERKAGPEEMKLLLED